MLCGSLDGREVWGRMDTCICMVESLCCSPETITTLLIGYTPIQNKKLKKKKKGCEHGRRKTLMGKVRACFKNLNYLTYVFIHSKTIYIHASSKQFIASMVDYINGPILHPSLHPCPLLCNSAVPSCSVGRVKFPSLGLRLASFSIDQWDIGRRGASVLSCFLLCFCHQHEKDWPLVPRGARETMEQSCPR